MSNKTSDKNVGSIEEDIKYVKEMLEIARVFFKAVKAETDYKNVDEIAFCNAIENILAEREQDKKRIQELEEKMNADNMLIIYELKQKDKRIQELEEENKHLSNVSDYETISLECVHLKEQLEIANSRIQELEIKLKCSKDLYDDCCKCLLDSISKQAIIDKIKENKQILDKTNDGNLRERLYIENGIMKELLEGERK